MHDPDVVAFEIPRPWPSRVNWGCQRWYWPAFITVWHREPGGRDSGEVCKHYTRHQDATGQWQTKLRNGWRFHVHHWRLQVHALQRLRRRLLIRCAWCGGPSRKRDVVNVSHSWDGPRGRWWQGEPGLYHRDCSSIASAHGACVCQAPLCADDSPTYGPYGLCGGCGKHRAFGRTPTQTTRMRMLAAIPHGHRDPDVYRRVCDLVAAEQDAQQQFAPATAELPDPKEQQQ